MDTLRLLFYLMLGANLASTLSLKGGDFPCTQPDGQEIRVPGITDVPTSVKIKCICQKGVGKCQKVRDVCLENLQGCHFFIKNSSNKNGTSSEACTKECRPCESDQTNSQKSGQILVQDKCNIKQCFSGVSTQTTLHCATPMCPNPRPPVQGQCCPTCKGQLILECLFGVIDFPKKQWKIWQISALASKKRSNQKKIRALYTAKLEDFILTLLHYFLIWPLFRG